MLADTAYDSDAIRAQTAPAGAGAVIPSWPDRTSPLHLDPVTYRDGNQTERCLNKLKQHRRVATRYAKLAASYAAFVQLRAITLWLN